MKKKGLVLCLVLCLVMGLCGVAGADEAVEKLDVYAGYELDRTTGEWSVKARESQLAWQLMERNATSFADSFVFMELEITGNVNSGRITPVLQITYVDAEEIFPTAVSFVCDGLRYDYTVSPVSTTVGREHAEIMRIPLDEKGIAMLRQFSACDRVMMKLGGGEGKCEVTFRVREKYNSQIQRVLGLALPGLEAMLAELDNLGFDGYELYDLNASEWKKAGGYESECQLTVLKGEDAEFAVTLDEDFEMLSTGDSGKSVTKLQERLMDLGYLYTTYASGTYYETTAEAVRMAQQWYGMLITGNADAEFVEKLFSDDQSRGMTIAETEKAVEAANVTGDAEATLGVNYAVEGVGEVQLNRSWFASSVSSVSDSGMTAQRTVTSRDNILLIADGSFKNLATVNASLYTDLTATAVYAGGYRYECQVVCEADGGARFDSSLLPLGEARIVCYAEVPATLEGESFQLEVKLGDYTLTYNLD